MAENFPIEVTPSGEAKLGSIDDNASRRLQDEVYELSARHGSAHHKGSGAHGDGRPFKGNPSPGQIYAWKHSGAGHAYMNSAQGHAWANSAAGHAWQASHPGWKR
jgi:hypothetical protein